jgi:amino acid permease
MPASDSETCVNLVNLCLGVGVLSFPWSLAGASVLGGLGIIAGGTLWCAATNVMMVALAEEVRQFNTGRVLRQLPAGRLLQPVGNAMLLLTQLLCLIGDLVVFADNSAKVLRGSQVAGALLDSAWSRPLLVWLGCLLVLPLSFLDQSRLACTSMVSVLATWYICFVLVGEAAVAPQVSRVCLLGWGVGDLTMLAVLMMATSAQQCMLPLYKEMENRSVRRFAVLQLTAVVVIVVLLSVVAIAGYLRYGSGVRSNILLELPSDGAGLLAQVSILPVVIGVYPLMLYPLTEAIGDFASGQKPGGCGEPLLYDEGSVPPAPQRSTERVVACGQVAIIAFTGLVAATGINLGPINDFTGILGLGWFTVAMPGLVYRQYLQLKGASSGLLQVHLAVGCPLALLAVVWTGNHVESVEANCAWWWPVLD